MELLFSFRLSNLYELEHTNIMQAEYNYVHKYMSYIVRTNLSHNVRNNSITIKLNPINSDGKPYNLYCQQYLAGRDFNISK